VVLVKLNSNFINKEQLSSQAFLDELGSMFTQTHVLATATASPQTNTVTARFSVVAVNINQKP